MTTDLIPPGQWLEQPANTFIEAPPHLWGFGALQGGLVLAVLIRAIRHASSDHGRVRSATGRLHHPVTGPFTTTTTRPRPGRATVEAVDKRAGLVVASASLVTSPARAVSLPAVAPRRPSVPPPEDCELYTIPAEFAPISAFMEIRPAGASRPYTGCEKPELTAWLRLTEDDRPPDLHRMIMLLDALAPSYSAILTTLQPVPTVELTVRPANGLDRATSPWTLLHTQTIMASPDGWLHERVDAWAPSGTHLASADQLRAVARPRATDGHPR